MHARLSLCLLACSVLIVSGRPEGRPLPYGRPLPSAQAPTTTTQNPQQQPTFRGGINYIRVDMYASTRDGAAITDLRKEEIQLLEDGKPQQVKDFEHVQVATGTPQAVRVEPNTIAESRQMAAEGRARVFVIFLDTFHTTVEGSATMRAPLVKFIDRLLGPDDMVALMTPEMSAGDITFGRKTTVISNILQREWTWGRRGRVNLQDPKEDLYRRCYLEQPNSANEMISRRREKLTLDALEDLVIFLQGVRDERKAVLTVSDGWFLYSPNRGLLPPPNGTFPGSFGPIRRTPGDQDPRDTGNEQVECEADRQVLAELHDADRLTDITGAANRTNVTFYPVGARGLVAFDSTIVPDDIQSTANTDPKKLQDSVFDPQSATRPTLSLQEDSANLRNRQASLRALAEDTDGIAVINTNDIDRGFSRIVADVSSYYLLGYESTNSKLDGKFRSIAVKVNRPGVQVRARKGYRSLTPEEVTTRAPATSTAPVNLPPPVAVDARAPFRIRSTTWMPSGGTGAVSVWLVGELDAASRKDAAWSSGGTADISVVSAGGDRVASLQVPFAAGDSGFSVKVPTENAIAPGDYAVRVRVTSRAGQALPLADLSRMVVPATAPGLGESIMLRRGLTTGPRYVATADPRFQRSDRLRLEIPTMLEGTATARLLDRTGKPLPVPVTMTDRPDESGTFHWVIADATLAPLAPGDYAVEVTVGTATRQTSFRIVP